MSAGWHFSISKRDEGSNGTFQSFGISTFRYDISSSTPITEPIQLWLKLKSSKFWELCPSEEQEFLNWMLIKWRKASLEIKDLNWYLTLNRKKMKMKENYILIFRTVSHVLTMSVYLRADSLLRTICFCSRYHAWSGHSIFLPRFQSYFIQNLYWTFSNLPNPWVINKNTTLMLMLILNLLPYS